jgi:hypothetical protein
VAADIKVTRTKKGDNQVKVSIKFAFDGNDPAGATVYRGIRSCIKEILSPDEAHDFLAKLKEARRNPTGGEISGRVK